MSLATLHCVNMLLDVSSAFPNISSLHGHLIFSGPIDVSRDGVLQGGHQAPGEVFIPCQSDELMCKWSCNITTLLLHDIPGGNRSVESKGSIKSLAELGPAAVATTASCSNSALLLILP